METKIFREYIKETNPSTCVRKAFCRKKIYYFLVGHTQMDFP